MKRLTNKIRTTTIIAGYLAGNFASVLTAKAEVNMGSFDTKILTPENIDASGKVTSTAVSHSSVAEYALYAINLMARVIGSFALLAAIIGAMMLMTSSGREHAQTRGKEIILQALLGIVVAFAAFVITAFVQGIFYAK